MRIVAGVVAIVALSVIPKAWREHGSDVIFLSTFLGAVSLILALIWKVFGKRAVRWADRRFDVAIKKVVDAVIIPVMEANDLYYRNRILQLEDRLEEVEATNGDRHAEQMAVLQAQLDAVRGKQAGG